MFPENDMIRIDYIIPDFHNYLADKKDKVRGIVFTHGHEDHIGAVHHILDEIPMCQCMPPMTRIAWKSKLNRYGIWQSGFCELSMRVKTFQIGPFKVDFFHVCLHPGWGWLEY